MAFDCTRHPGTPANETAEVRDRFGVPVPLCEACLGYLAGWVYGLADAMMLELDAGDAATLAGALSTAHETLTRGVNLVPAEHRDAALAGVAGVEALLVRVGAMVYRSVKNLEDSTQANRPPGR